MHVEEERFFGRHVDDLAIHDAEVLQGLRQKADLDLGGVDEAVLQFERFQVGTALADAFEDRRRHRLVVHPVAVVEEAADGDRRRLLAEEPEEFSEVDNGERLRRGVDAAPQGLVGGDV